MEPGNIAFSFNPNNHNKESLTPDLLKKIADQLILHEGLRLKPYHCPAGKHTIGIGRNLEDKGITEKEALIIGVRPRYRSDN